MKRYAGLYQRRSGIIDVHDRQLVFYFEGEVNPAKAIRFSNLMIRNVGINSPQFLLEDRTTPGDGITCMDRSMIEDLAKLGSQQATLALGKARKVSQRTKYIIGGAIAFVLLLLIALPLLLLTLPASLVDPLVSLETEKRVLGSLGGSPFESAQSSSDELNTLFKFLKDKNPSLDGLPISVSVTKHETANAFTLPGGDIVFTESLLNEAKSVEEIVGILGHELGHVKKRHILRSSFKSLGIFSGVIILQLIVGQEIAGLVELGANLTTLSFSRSQEEEADRYGFELLHNAQVSPQGFVDFFERLQEKEKSLPSGFSLLLTHPLSEKRKENIKELMVKYPPQQTVALPVTLSELHGRSDSHGLIGVEEPSEDAQESSSSSSSSPN